MSKIKKGFTIVELAIVLVVIGIILSMVVKGKNLVDSARVRADLAKVRKIQAGVHIYFAKTGRTPVYGVMDPGNTSLLDIGGLTKEDFILEILHMPHPTTGNTLNRLSLVDCHSELMTSQAGNSHYGDVNGTDMGWAWEYYVGATGRQGSDYGVCIMTGEDIDHNPTNPVVAGGATHFYVCHMEQILDDEYDRSGSGRQSANINASSTQTRLLDYSDCAALRNDPGRELYFYSVM